MSLWCMCFSRKFKDELILPDSDTLQWDKKKMCFFLLKLWRKFSMLDGYFRAWGGPLFVNVALTQWVSPDVIINPAIRPADFGMSVYSKVYSVVYSHVFHGAIYACIYR